MNNGLGIRIKREYEKLAKACKQKNCLKILKVMNFLFRYSRPTDDVFPALYILIQNNYISEAKMFIERIPKSDSNQFVISLLKKAIFNQKNYQSLTEEERVVYEDAIFYGHSYYEVDDYSSAYDIYEWGYYVTNQPIFLYYIGKMLYKTYYFYEAEQYFLEYLKTGDSKISKANLYLANIEKKRHNYEKAGIYVIRSMEADKVYCSNFLIDDTFLKEQGHRVRSLKQK